jgi:hypothetical protein
LKWQNDPSCFCVRRTAHEGAIRKHPHDPGHVVFDILPVVRQVWISPSFARREKNVEAPPPHAEADTRPHGTLPDVMPNQWPFELINESMHKGLDDNGSRLPAREIVIDDPPPEPRSHRSAKP